MAQRREDIIIAICDHIAAHIAESDNSSGRWYIGITKDWERRLFEDHKVLRDNVNLYIYCEAESVDDAREIESHLIENLDECGGGGGGDEESRYVYAYKIMPYTKQKA